MAIVVIGTPMILGLAVFRDWALARFLKRHTRALHATQAVVWIVFTVGALLGTSEFRWLMAETGAVLVILAVVQAIRVPGEGCKVRSSAAIRSSTGSR